VAFTCSRNGKETQGKHYDITTIVYAAPRSSSFVIETRGFARRFRPGRPQGPGARTTARRAGVGGGSVHGRTVERAPRTVRAEPNANGTRKTERALIGCRVSCPVPVATKRFPSAAESIRETPF